MGFNGDATGFNGIWWDLMGCHEIFQYGQNETDHASKKSQQWWRLEMQSSIWSIYKKCIRPADVHVGSILKGCRKKYHRYPWKAEGKNISTCLWLGSIQTCGRIYNNIYIDIVCVLGYNPVTYPCTVCKTTGGRWPWDRQRWLGKTPSNVAKAIGIHLLQF